MHTTGHADFGLQKIASPWKTARFKISYYEK